MSAPTPRPRHGSDRPGTTRDDARHSDAPSGGGAVAPAWLDELVAPPGPPWHAMGTRALDTERWLLPDADREGDLATKRALLAERPQEVVACLPTAEAAAQELLELVEACTGQVGDVALHPLAAAGLLVQEDLCLLVQRDGAWRLEGATLSFPSYWRLADKLGRPMVAVHEPVPAYAEELGARVDRFLDRLGPDRLVWRRNWSIHDDPTLFLPEPTPPRRVDPPDGLWLRSERQTLRRLPETAAICFTIRTQQTPLAVLGQRPDVAGLLAAAIRAWSPELRAYKGGHGALAALPWLTRIAG